MLLLRQIFLAITLCGSAFASTSPDALREMIMAGDLVAVEAALADDAVQKSDTVAGRIAQRQLFAVFSVTHPAVGSFTANWLQKDPSSALAMTARGWHLYTMGWANRGEGPMRAVTPEGAQQMQILHQQAFSLFETAVQANPQLVAASDGILRLALTIGSDARIPIELERIMSLYPSRHSLMLAMYRLAPQWGGTPKQIQLLCDRYAPVIQAIGDPVLGDYTPAVCVVDAVYFAEFREGPMLDAARIALPTMTNPILDHARFDDAVNRVGPVSQRLAMMEKAKSETTLNPDEVFTWWTTKNEATNAMGDGFDDPEYRLAITQGLDMLRQAADQDPLSPFVVYDYIDQYGRHAADGGQTDFQADAIQRVKTLLTGIPHSWTGWGLLANLSRGEDIGDLEKSVRYFKNEIFYANYGIGSLQDAIGGIARGIDAHQHPIGASGMANMTKAKSLELDSMAKCPLLALVRIADAVCGQDQLDSQSCLRNAGLSGIEPILADIEARGVCQTETTAPLNELLFGPQPADF